MADDKQKLEDGGWVEETDGVWVLSEAFEGVNEKRQLVHVPFGTIRDLAGAMKLENLRSVDLDLDPKLKASAKVSQKNANDFMLGMEKLEERNSK